MVIYKISDEVNTAQGLPLHELYNIILEALMDESFDLYLLSAEGYGKTIFKLENILKDKNKTIITSKEFNNLSLGIEEWFYNVDLEIKLKDNIIWFGLTDSSYLYIATKKDFLFDKVLKSFKYIEPIISLPWEKYLVRSKLESKN